MTVCGFKEEKSHSYKSGKAEKREGINIVTSPLSRNWFDFASRYHVFLKF